MVIDERIEGALVAGGAAIAQSLVTVDRQLGIRIHVGDIPGRAGITHTEGATLLDGEEIILVAITAAELKGSTLASDYVEIVAGDRLGGTLTALLGRQATQVG